MEFWLSGLPVNDLATGLRVTSHSKIFSVRGPTRRVITVKKILFQLQGLDDFLYTRMQSQAPAAGSAPSNCSRWSPVGKSKRVLARASDRTAHQALCWLVFFLPGGSKSFAGLPTFWKGRPRRAFVFTGPLVTEDD